MLLRGRLQRRDLMLQSLKSLKGNDDELCWKMLQVKIQKRKEEERMKENPQCLIVCGFNNSMIRHSARTEHAFNRFCFTHGSFFT